MMGIFTDVRDAVTHPFIPQIKRGGEALGSAFDKLSGADAAEDAARAQQRGQQSGIDELRRQYDISRQDFQPYREYGEESLNQLRSLMGGDTSGFYEDPGYQFALGEGEKGINRLASATGRFGAGSNFKDISRFNQGLASQGFADYYNRLAGGAGAGQAASGQVAGLGAGTAQGIAQGYRGIGDAQASGELGKYAGRANLVNNLFRIGASFAGGGG